MNKLTNNITYTKILSIEYYFLYKHEVLIPSNIITQNTCREEKLLAKYPIASFFYYRITNKYFQQMKKLNNMSSNEFSIRLGEFESVIIKIIDQCLQPQEQFSLKKIFDKEIFENETLSKEIDEFYQPTSC